MRFLNKGGFASPPPAATARYSKDKALGDDEIHEIGNEVKHLHKRIDQLKDLVSREYCEICNYEWMASLHRGCPSCFMGSLNEEFLPSSEPSIPEFTPAAGGGARQGDNIRKDELE